MTGSVTPKDIDSWTRAKELYWSLPPSLRLIVITVIAGIAIFVGYSRVKHSPRETAYVLGGRELSAVQLQTCYRALDYEGLTGYQIDGSRIKVPRERLAQFAAALAKHDVLPSGFYAPFDKAAENSSWLTTSTQDDRRWELAKQKSLAQLIEQMPEISAASVLIDRVAPRGLRATADARATVTVQPKSGRELPPFRIRQIRNLVAGSVVSLAPENVAVVDLNGRALLELGAPGTSSDDLLMRMKEFEEHYAWKVHNVLSYLSDVTVMVSVELETTKQRRTEQLVAVTADEPGTVAAKSDQDITPTVLANSATELDLMECPPAEPQSTQQTWEEHVALGPKSVSVAVSVPQDVVATLVTAPSVQNSNSNWQDAIRQRIAGAIPSGIATTITVNTYPRRTESSGLGGTMVSDPLPHPWTAWGTAAVVSAVVLVSVLALGGVFWRQARVQRQRFAISQRPPSDSKTTGEGVGSRKDDNRRELIRIERHAARSNRAPHLIQATIASFEDLRWLAPSSLQAVLSAVDSRLWAPALRGASRELCDRILAHMPARAATLLRDEIEFPGPVRLGDVETAQQEILEIVRRLDHTGDLVLEDREEILHE